MPYKVKGQCVYHKNTNKKVGCTKGSVKKYLAALHANADESIESEETITESSKTTKELIKRLIRENLGI